VNIVKRVVGKSQVLWRIPMTDVGQAPCSLEAALSAPCLLECSR
jgi:hypothetical protein